MSKLANKVEKLLNTSFPHNSIILEHYVNFKNTRLFFDFYIKEWSVLIEVQGKQHEQFVQHFHGDRDGFLASKKRDNLKKEYCEKNKLTLVEITSEVSKKELLDKIWSAINND